MSRRRKQWAEDSQIRIDLSAGAAILVSFTGNLFDLSAEERRLVSDLSITLQKFKEESIAKATAAAGEIEARIITGPIKDLAPDSTGRAAHPR